MQCQLEEFEGIWGNQWCFFSYLKTSFKKCSRVSEHSVRWHKGLESFLCWWFPGCWLWLSGYYPLDSRGQRQKKNPVFFPDKCFSLYFLILRLVSFLAFFYLRLPSFANLNFCLLMGIRRNFNGKIIRFWISLYHWNWFQCIKPSRVTPMMV